MDHILRQVCIDACQKELDALPSEDTLLDIHTFSPRFEKKISSLLQNAARFSMDNNSDSDFMTEAKNAGHRAIVHFGSRRKNRRTVGNHPRKQIPRRRLILIAILTAVLLAFCACAQTIIRSGILPHGLQYKIFPMTADEKNEFNRGILPNGLEYEVVPMTADEIDAFDNGISTSSCSWSGDISVPVVSSSKANGAQLGADFTVSSDSSAVVYVGSLPTKTMPTVNIAAVAEDETSDKISDSWILNVESNSKIYLHPSAVYTGGSYKVFVGTSELYSESVWLSISAE